MVDTRLEVWARELPSLDLATEGVVERIQKLAHHLERSLGETAGEFGLSLADWHMLAALRGSGEPYRQTAGKLASWLSLSPGAMTSRIDKLEERGWVRRVPDLEDRRVLHVELTDEGRSHWEEAVGVQAAREQLVAAALDERQKETLNRLLRKLMLSFEATAAVKREQPKSPATPAPV